MRIDHLTDKYVEQSIESFGKTKVLNGDIVTTFSFKQRKELVRWIVELAHKIHNNKTFSQKDM